MTEGQKRACLQYNPFEGDFGDQGDRIFADRITTARKPGPCHICPATIQPGELMRRHEAKYDGEMRSYRWCSLCCAAMAISWDDDGEAIEARYALNRNQVPA